MDDIAIKVEHISKAFKLPHEKSTSIKGILINKLRGGNKGYERQEVLKDVSFEIKKGEFFGIVGRNGSGKSTLLKLLAGIYSPTSGSISVEGKITPFIELGVGFNPELTGRENVFLNGALLGFNRAEMLVMYDDIVAFAELERFMDQKLKNYSSGMQVRLAFSIAIRARGDILILDEVLAVGDEAFQQKCYDYFEQLKQAHRTVVFVSHDMSAVRRFCTRAIYLDKGRITFDGHPADIAEAYSEDNMASILKNQTTEEKESRNNHTINVEIINQDKVSDILKFKLSFKSEVPSYVGFSLIKDGLTFAEMNSLDFKSQVKQGNFEYSLDTNMLNAGMYEISGALLDCETKQPLAITQKRARFKISGRDLTRGGAISLKDSWESEV